MILQIKEPCKADWQSMSPQAGDRYCAQCDKVVKDFTQMSDAQVYDFVKQNRNTCGRFNQQQLNRTLLPQPTSTYQYKWYGKAAAGTLLMSAFLPNPLNAQTIDSTNIPIVNTLTINTSVFASSVMNGSVVQPDSIGKRIKQIEFSIDTFRLLVDLNTNTAFNFQVPGQYVGDSIDVELRLVDESIQSLKIGGTNMFMNAWHYRSSLCFVYYNERWTSQILGQPVLDVVSLGGIYPHIEFKPLEIKWPTTFTLGDINSDTDDVLKVDTVLPPLPEAADYIKIKSNKLPSKPIAWLWYLWIGLAGLGIAFLKFRKTRKPIIKETNPSNPDSEDGDAIN
jgi:hypothetical protein